MVKVIIYISFVQHQCDICSSLRQLFSYIGVLFALFIEIWLKVCNFIPANDMSIVATKLSSSSKISLFQKCYEVCPRTLLDLGI